VEASQPHPPPSRILLSPFFSIIVSFHEHIRSRFCGPTKLSSLFLSFQKDLSLSVRGMALSSPSLSFASSSFLIQCSSSSSPFFGDPLFFALLHPRAPLPSKILRNDVSLKKFRQPFLTSVPLVSTHSPPFKNNVGPGKPGVSPNSPLFVIRYNFYKRDNQFFFQEDMFMCNLRKGP